MRIHLGHHFYGAGNLGDDFMLAGFLRAMRTLVPSAAFTCCVPFALEPLRERFPEVTWLPYEDARRLKSIQACDVWLGLGGSPFQSALSRWFVDHLVAEEALCERESKPMFFLGVGVQTPTELGVPDVRRLCARAAGIWTRDTASAERLRALPSPPAIVEAAADLAHLFFRDFAPPRAKPGRLTAVVNFDYGQWPGQDAFLKVARRRGATEHVWLAQESRELPGAERALYGALPAPERARWQLASPEKPGAPLGDVLARWPSGEWLVTARYHAALAGAWAGSKIVVLSINEKLRAAARELQVPLLAAQADVSMTAHAFDSAIMAAPPRLQAERAQAACADFVRSAVAHQR